MKNSRALTAVMWPASSALHAATLDLEILCGIKDEVLAGGLRPVFWQESVEIFALIALFKNR